jgi:hypothetical protein
MKIVEVDFRKKMVENFFRASEGQIEEIYFKISEYVLIALYKAYPFHSLYEGFSWDHHPNDFFKSCLFTWADYFKSREVNCFEKTDIALKKLIEKNVIPSLGMFCSVYFGGEVEMLYAEFEDYLAYLHQHAVFDEKNLTQKIYNADLYSEWRENIKNKKIAP